MRKLTNLTDGLRGVHTKTGSVFIGPGESAEVDMEAAEYEVAMATGWFGEGEEAEVDEEEEVETEVEGGDDFDSMTMVDLRAYLDENGIEYPKSALKADLVTLARSE